MSYKSMVLGLSPVHFVHDNLVDEAGTNDLIAVGSPTRHTTDTPGDGIPDYWELNGTSQHLEAADDPVFHLNPNLGTYVWWVRRDANPQADNFRNFWAKGDTLGHQSRTGTGGTADIAVYFTDRSDGTDVSAIDNNHIPNADVWQMVVARIGATDIELLRVSTSDGSVTVGASATKRPAGAGNSLKWTVGAQNDTGTNIRRWWRGHIVPPVIFDYALSDAEITSIWEARDDTDAFPSASLLATATGTIVDVVNEADNTTDLHLSVDDDPASPNDSDWVNNAVDVT